MNKTDLNDWNICNPDLRQDPLPQPYKLINEILNETILYNLKLSMFDIQNKKKDKNYEGGIKEFVCQNTIDVENIACFSNVSKHHNHLVAGDKCGNIYLLDLAKKSVFSKKELVPGKRVIFISQTFINDGDLAITTIAVILNNHNKIYLLRYKHTQPKLILTHTIDIASDQNDPNKLPYSCQFDDYARTIIVYTYDGSIMFYRLPEVVIDLNEINKNLTIPLEEEEFKKRLRYPLNYSIIQQDIGKINDKFLEIKFEGKKIPLTKQQILAKLAKKAEAPPTEVDIKKDPKKKQEKKVEPEEAERKQTIQFNTPLKKAEPLIENGNDNTPSYPQPKFKPFVYILHTKLQLEKKKEFQRERFVQISERVVYGWTNTKQFKVCLFYAKKSNYYPNYLYIQHFLQKIPQKWSKEKQDYLNQKITLKNIKTFKNIDDITSTSISIPDEQYLACGLVNGAITVWITNTMNVVYNTEKHKGSVTNIRFFEGWKIISGSIKGEVQIDNILSLANQVKRTNVFESKQDYPISDIRISQLGIAFILDSNANLRVYDMWRSQKISRVQSCNSFALLQNRGKRWVPSSAIKPSVTLYSNNDFTAIISTNWPNFTSREIQESQQKRKQIKTLINNPWKCKGSNVHVIRNFQFLLAHFDGLETTYKRGYQRKKVQNLFTNLEFTQLYDRNFQIPDFGVTSNPDKRKGDKGSQAGFGTGSKTHISSKSREKLMKDSSSSQITRGKYKLTDQVLHPQKFLLQRRKIDKEEIIDDEKLRNSIRQIYKKQGALQNTLTADFSKNLL